MVMGLGHFRGERVAFALRSRAMALSTFSFGTATILFASALNLFQPGGLLVGHDSPFR